MPKIKYIDKNLRKQSLEIIEQAENIFIEYAMQGFKMSLRQIYYKFVARDIFPDDRRWRQIEGTNKWVKDSNGTKNADPNYKWLGDKITDGRLAGLLDWGLMEDRARNMAEKVSHWDSPSEIVNTCIESYHKDLWSDQPNLVEVWVEKDALSEVVERACVPLDVDFMACKGYMSQSEMWAAGQRYLDHIRLGKKIVIIHVGDHDPSGIDMTRDIFDRLDLYVNSFIDGEDAVYSVKRIALNMDQINDLNLPPNPAKVTDPRAAEYIYKYGELSWELDALEPAMLMELITNNIIEYRDDDLYQAAYNKQEYERNLIEDAVQLMEDELGEDED